MLLSEVTQPEGLSMVAPKDGTEAAAAAAIEEPV